MTLRARLDAFLLRDAERAAARLSPDGARAVADACKAAGEHLDAARSLATSRTARSSALVYRAAIDALLVANAAVDGEEVAPRGAALAVRGIAPKLVERAAAVLDEEGSSRASLVACDAICVALRGRVEPRSPARVRRARFVRVAIATAALLAALGAGATWARRPRDLARGRRVTASSVLFGDPDALVAGSVPWGRYALHTERGGVAWVVVDLGEERSIAEVRVYNRGDGYFEQATGTSIELSDDGAMFRRVGACNELFTQVNPCRLPLRDQRGRYVRVTHGAALVLGAIEVLGS